MFNNWHWYNSLWMCECVRTLLLCTLYVSLKATYNLHNWSPINQIVPARPHANQHTHTHNRHQELLHLAHTITHLLFRFMRLCGCVCVRACVFYTYVRKCVRARCLVYSELCDISVGFLGVSAPHSNDKLCSAPPPDCCAVLKAPSGQAHNNVRHSITRARAYRPKTALQSKDTLIDEKHVYSVIEPIPTCSFEGSAAWLLEDTFTLRFKRGAVF